MKHIMIILFSIVGIVLDMSAKNHRDTIQPPIINLLENNTELKDNRNLIDLDKVVIIHPQLDSILIKMTKGLGRESNLCFYITIMKYEDRLYLEIFEDYPNNYLFEINNKGDSLFQRLNRNIYGYAKYNNIDIYLLLYSNSYRPNEETLGNLICKTKEQITISQKPKDFYFTQENPMWLYEYFDGNINLIESVNDKGFFSNP